MFTQVMLASTSVSANTNTSIVDVSDLESIAIQINVSNNSSLNTAVATLQVSNDGTNFVSLSKTASLTGNGSFMIQDTAFGYKFIKVAITLVSGSGTMYVLLCGKDC